MIDVIASQPVLESLTIDRCSLPPEELPRLSASKKLRSLKLIASYRRSTSEQALPDPAWIADLRSLEELDLAETRVDQKLIETLARLPRLQTLRFDNCRLDAGVCARLDSLPKLRALTLSGIRVSEAELRQLTLPGSTEWLDLRNVRGGTAVERVDLIKSLPPDCRVLVTPDEYSVWKRQALLTTALSDRLTTKPRQDLERPVEY